MFQKYFSLLAKKKKKRKNPIGQSTKFLKSVSTVNFQFKRKFKKMSTIIRNSVNLKASIRSLLIFLYSRVVNPSSSNLSLSLSLSLSN